MVRLTLVRLAKACSSCAIVENLVREAVGRVRAEIPELDVSEHVVDSPREIAGVPNLEVERFPALILEGEQITAGSIITPRDLRRLVESELSDGKTDY